VRAFFMVSQALMPKRCNVLLEAVKELPPLQVLETKDDGLCHDRAGSASAAADLCRIASCDYCAAVRRQLKRSTWHFNGD
jgi:hypothetical protein